MIGYNTSDKQTEVSEMRLPQHWSSSIPGSTPAGETRIWQVLEAERALRARRVLDPPRSARLAARLLGARLDRALIVGADPASSPRLAARAAWLTTRATRARLADGLELLLARAQQPPSRRALAPRHASVLANAELVRELAGTLRGPAPLYAGGVAMIRGLLTDGTGPVYASRDGAALEHELRRACAAVCG
jgi:hypothetical protein